MPTRKKPTTRAKRPSKAKRATTSARVGKPETRRVTLTDLCAKSFSELYAAWRVWLAAPGAAPDPATRDRINADWLVEISKLALAELGTEIGHERARDRLFLALVQAGGPARQNTLWWAQAITQPLANFASPLDRAAYEMVSLGARALVTKAAPDTELVSEWDAWMSRASGPHSDVLAIKKIANAVGIAARFRKHREDPQCATVARDAAKNLREYLVAAFGETIPAESELQDWIDRHAKRGARGRLTTAGIVTRIIRGGRLLGVNSAIDGEQTTLDHVDKTLRRDLGRRNGRTRRVE